MRDDHVAERERLGGVQRMYDFSNGYGASVIRHEGSMGYDHGLWECAAIYKDGDLVCMPGMRDVAVGHMNENEVDDFLHLVESRPPLRNEESREVQCVIRNFEIGDIVEIGSLDGWYEVIVILPESERLFVATGPEWEKQEFQFSDVVAQYRRVDT